MNQLFPKPWTMLRLILIPMFLLAACQAKTDGSSATTQEPELLSVEADVVFGSGPFNFPDTRAGLADQSSYKATLIMSFDGTRDGQPSQWSKTYVMHTTKEPATLQLTIEKTGDLINPDPVFMAEMDGAAYERRGEDACTAIVIEEGNSLSERLEPAGFLSGVIGAEEAGAETVNDVASDKYAFDERAFGQSGLAQSTGEMWVASEGGYIVKYLMTTTGNADYFGEGIEGTLMWDYELTDVNRPVTIELPADCPAGMIDAPLLPDATNVSNVPSMLAYDTASSLSDAAAFYQQQLPDLGWQASGEPAVTETTALLEFTQGDQSMTIIITAGDGGTKVHIVQDSSTE